MPAERVELRIPAQRLLIGVLVVVIPICLAGLFSVAQTDRSLEKEVGAHYKTIAESTASAVSQFVHDRLMGVGVMAVEPTIVDAIAAANKSYEGKSDAQIQDSVQKIDKTWNTAASEPMVKAMLSSPASRLLRRHRDLDPRFLRITVTDAKGATVAATHKTLDYFQADDEYWQNIFANGRGAVSITDILYDDVTKSNYIGIGVPVLEEGSNRFIGTVDALIDMSSIFPVVNRIRPASGSKMMLVKDDGTVIAGPDVSLSMKLKSEEFDAVRDALTTVSGRQNGFVVAGLRGGGRRLVGFADTGLKQDYRNLGWLVLASEDTQAAFAAIRAVERLLGLLSVLGLAGATLLGVYVALHRERAFADIGDLRQAAPPSPRTASA